MVLLRIRRKRHDNYLQIFEKDVTQKADFIIYAIPESNKWELQHGRVCSIELSSAEGKL